MITETATSFPACSDREPIFLSFGISGYYEDGGSRDEDEHEIESESLLPSQLRQDNWLSQWTGGWLSVGNTKGEDGLDLASAQGIRGNGARQALLLTSSPDGKTLAMVQSHILRLIESVSKSEILSVELNSGSPSSSSSGRIMQRLVDLSFSANSKSILTVDENGVMKAYECDCLQLIGT